MRFHGTFLAHPADVPPVVARTVARELAIADPECRALYARREQTHREHAGEIQRAYGYRDFEDTARAQLTAWLHARAWTTAERPSVLFDLATVRLIEAKVLLCGASVLARLVAATATAPGGPPAAFHHSLVGDSPCRLVPLARARREMADRDLKVGVVGQALQLGLPQATRLPLPPPQSERLADGMLASVLLIDDEGAHLRHGGAPSLPAADNEAIDGIGTGRGQFVLRRCGISGRPPCSHPAKLGDRQARRVAEHRGFTARPAG